MSKVSHQTLIERFQKQNDKLAEVELLEIYYLPACKYALSFLRRNIYSNLIKYEIDEVKSYVYFAFFKSLKNYRFDTQENSLSFKNYLFQMVQYESLKEIKKNFAWQKIVKYDEQCSNEKNFIIHDSEKDMLNKLNIQIKSEQIYLFLQEKKELYGQIWKLKCQGFDNRDISKKLNISPSECKSKFQYIKKIINKHFTSDQFS